MSTGLTHGTLTLTVDLEHDHIDVGLSEQRALDDVANRLMSLFTQYSLPATWAVSDPAESAARAKFDVSRHNHELALLGDTTWVGKEAGRARFARELTRRVARAQHEGISVRTLVLRTPLPVEHSDLAIKEGIIAARLPESVKARGNNLRPQALRFGLWGFSSSTNLPGSSRWLPGGGGLRAARFEIDKAITDRGQVHLSIHAPQLARRGDAAMRIVERVLQHATRRREHGLLHVATLGMIAGRLGQENQGQPSRSILRPAA